MLPKRSIRILHHVLLVRRLFLCRLSECPLILVFRLVLVVKLKKSFRQAVKSTLVSSEESPKVFERNSRWGIMNQSNSACKLFAAFSDADYTGDLSTRKSTSGMIFKFSGGAIQWASKRKKCISVLQLKPNLPARPVKKQSGCIDCL
ncbi:hypothetical protein AVEN_209771-1 [Araneus ventricosus]|uniref:Retrovirus-related Pol polyprotein from transposon TNT 1-94 n=1 Tax=Araneus ventricosus TaxID=182803 RepID=A0A4Y2CDY3_ARAVE|nr:hypothetical protein AVEN_209771-1 [Araneus ventricosus]